MALRKEVIIYANRRSASAGILGRALNCRRWMVERPRLNGGTINADRLVVNWGTTEPPTWWNAHGKVLNQFAEVRRSISKVESYNAFAAAGVPTLEFTLDTVQVSQWLSDSHSVLARRDGLASGRGIRILTGREPPEGGFRDGLFYAKYFPKTHEYRVHVFLPRAGFSVPPPPQGEGIADSGSSVQPSGVIDITQKKRSVDRMPSIAGDSEVVPQQVVTDRTLLQRIVRSHANGWVHAHEGLHLPSEARVSIESAAVQAVVALGLDFGAVDILARYSKKNPSKLKQLAVCEVNTAPGLENQVTIEAYTNAIKSYREVSRV